MSEEETIKISSLKVSIKKVIELGLDVATIEMSRLLKC
jgi:hypothetical protein